MKRNRSIKLGIQRKKNISRTVIKEFEIRLGIKHRMGITQTTK